MSEWSHEARTKSLISRSAVVTQALKAHDVSVGREAYEELQSLEGQVVAAGATFEIAQAAQQAAQVKRDAAEKDLSALNSACLVICKVKGVSAAAYEEFDGGDPVGLAIHLETPVRRMGTIGANMLEMLRQQREILARCSGELDPAVENANRAEDALRSVLFKLEAGIAIARSLLSTKGVVVKFPKARPVKKAKARTGGEASTTPNEHAAGGGPKNGAASNGATTIAQPPSPMVATGSEVS